MDSVQSLNKFFGKLNDEFVTIANNSKTNSTTLNQLYTSEQKEEQGRNKAAARAKMRKGRTARRKKRSKLDTVKMLKSVFNSIFGKDAEKKDGNGLMKNLLIGAGVAALIGGGALLALKNSIFSFTLSVAHPQIMIMLQI